MVDASESSESSETYGETEIDTETWRGTRFVMRSGKALARRRKEVVVRFKGLPANALRDGIDGRTDIALQLQDSFSGPPSRHDDLALSASSIGGRLAGGSKIAVGAEEAELA